jgi:type VI secretion system secreted protein VgrG
MPATGTEQASPTQDRRLLNVSTPLGKDALLLRRFSGREAISELFSFRLELLSVDTAVRFDGIVGQRVDFALRLADNASYRPFNGFVSAFAQLSDEGRFAVYEAEVVPWLWFLGRASDCRIFQNLTVPEIIENVFGEAGFGDYEMRLSRPYRTWEYLVQYRETHLNFVLRLMEQEGICFFFRHEEGRHVMVLADTPQAHKRIPATPRVRYLHAYGGSRYGEADSVGLWRRVQRFSSGRCAVNDYNFKTSRAGLVCNADTLISQGGNGRFELYDYPGEFADRGEGEAVARLMMEEEETPQTVAEGAGVCRSMAAGGTFELWDHGRADQNRGWLLTAVEHYAHEGGTYVATGGVADAAAPRPVLRGGTGVGAPAGEGPAAAHAGATVGVGAVHENGHLPDGHTPPATSATGGNGVGGTGGNGQAAAPAEAPEPTLYENRFACIPEGVPFRPPRRTPRPEIRGSQTALVVGPAGEEIWCDSFGRVKLHFWWDRRSKRNENSSCWIRVSQNWAGKAWGGMWLPRIGQEVIVEHLEGDPDRPIITGRVYNDSQVVPYPLPAEQTKSTLKSLSSKGGGGFNEVRFEDRKGDEQIFVHGEKDLDVRIKNDRREWIGKDRHLIVTANKREDVGADKHVNVGANLEEKIGSSAKVTVGSSLDVNVGAASKESVGASKDVTVGGSHAESAGGERTMQVGGKLTAEVGGDVGVLAGGNMAQAAGGDMHILVGGGWEGKAAKNFAVEAGKEIHLKAGDKFVLEAGTEITIKSKGGFVKIDSSGVIVQGKKVKINTGGSPGKGSGAKPKPPTPGKGPSSAATAKPIRPDEADDAKPGSVSAPN